jgi:tetratricopeptide (TPR) repeat protein
LVIPTYVPAAPDKNPMFLERRVYQGSSGKVYPLPFTDRIAEHAEDLKWQAVWLENEFLQVLILPELGGRIHAILDKTNGYDLIYRQSVIKPALVGLAGPWISGGIEFNWPQHHRPATFLPVDYQIETHRDGSKTVWCSDHDPMARMKAMHGICLHPGRAYVELKVRAYNRTPLTQTFLWWANVATRVHEAYQSFFPPDVTYVADHAKRATSAYPLCDGFYYGVDYGRRARQGIPEHERPAQFIPPHVATGRDGHSPSPDGAPLPHYSPNDLSFYANIPTPCSYMCMGSNEDFFGGYDYARQAGLIHIADHHISPGKKQWTWGNHAFGYAWDRNLTDVDAHGEYGPYIELMAGVYTDNQPDFSFLRPGETKAWRQYWYPIQKIGPAQCANLDAALSLVVDAKEIRIGVSVTSPFPRATIRLETRNGARRWNVDLAPGKSFYRRIRQLAPRTADTDCKLRVLSRSGQEIISYQPQPAVKRPVPAPATEPPAPSDVQSTDELYLVGLHLEQYRHASRCPTVYWREGLRRDPGDCRCNSALGLWHLRRGEFELAESCFRKAIERLTRRNPNPVDGEAFYNLGVCLRHQGRDEDSYAAFYKATWNQAWQAAGFHAVAEGDCRRGDWPSALAHLDQALCYNCENTRARNVKALVLRKLSRAREATALLAETLALDPLDWWARHLSGEKIGCDLQVLLDLVHDYGRAGFYEDAAELLESATGGGVLACGFWERPAAIDVLGKTMTSQTFARDRLPDQNLGAEPLVYYTLGWLKQKLGKTTEALSWYKKASKCAPDYCFPSRLEEIAILEAARRANPKDARAACYLGNLLFDRKRHEEAIELWEQSTRLDPTYSVAWRNLGIGYFNVRKNAARARAAYQRAFRINPTDARLLYERDQLWKRLGESPRKRLRELERYPALVRRRDDLSVELCALLNQTQQHRQALEVLASRRFQPWEGGEGQALGQHVRTHLSLGKAALFQGDAALAHDHFQQALSSPPNLGEAKHLLANQSDIYYWLGIAASRLGESQQARQHWKAAAESKGDFQEMRVRSFSEMTYYSALAWRRLGKEDRARSLLRQLLAYGQELFRQPAKIEYFATSLPTMLLFEDDLDFRQQTTALFLQAQARLGLGGLAAGLKLVLARDPNHSLAADLLSQTENDLAGNSRTLRRAVSGNGFAHLPHLKRAHLAATSSNGELSVHSTTRSQVSQH